MKLISTLGTLSLGAILALSGCGSSNNSNGDSALNYTKTFKSQSVDIQIEELMGGIIGITDEVNNCYMGDPMGDNLAGADTTLVESQFSWNSTKDFYDNIYSIKKIWDGGLGDIATGVDASKATVIATEIDEALALITAISDQDGDGTLEYSDVADGAKSFRAMIQDATGRTAIEAAQAKLADLQAHLEELKPILVAATFTAADKTKAASIIDTVIVKGYTDLKAEADKLVTALTTLETTPNATNVTAARDQWRAARSPWEAGEGHIFGPVATLGIDPKVDSWSVLNAAGLDNALVGYDPEFANIDGYPVNMKGFHAMEYMLFGNGTALETPDAAVTRLTAVVGEDTVADKIRLAYLKALGISFTKDITALSNAWTK